MSGPTSAQFSLAQAPANATGGAPASTAVTLPLRTISDAVIPQAIQINPAWAGDFIAMRHAPMRPVPGDNHPAVPLSKVADQTQAARGAPIPWKKRTLSQYTNDVLFGVAPPQQFGGMKSLRMMKFIPPLALFNDASQWVNKLLLHRPMTWFGCDTSFFPLKAQYNIGPNPINTQNLAAGEINLQLQLGQLQIQAQQLTMTASNYYGAVAG
jgi:hypothetical protein